MPFCSSQHTPLQGPQGTQRAVPIPSTDRSLSGAIASDYTAELSGRDVPTYLVSLKTKQAKNVSMGEIKSSIRFPFISSDGKHVSIPAIPFTALPKELKGV